MRIEAIVADLDGTLVRPDFSVSGATIAAVRDIRAAGLRLVIATGRAPVHLPELGPLLSYADIAVCCSGAIGRAGPRQLWQLPLSRAAVDRVVETAGRYGAGLAGFDGTRWHVTGEYQRLNPAITTAARPPEVSLPALSSLRCVAMAAVHSRGVLPEIVAALGDSVRTGLSQVAGRPIVDITSARVDKGTGVRRALTVLHVNPAAAISFGDQPSDIPMFAVTGCAYAVGAVSPAVGTAAGATLDPVEHDGFARKIRALATAQWRLP